MAAAWRPFQKLPRTETYRTAMSNRDRQTLVEYNLPPKIADNPHPELSAAALAAVAAAENAMPRRAAGGSVGGVLEGLLLRTEAINSTRIEGYRTGVRNLCLAATGAKVKEGAQETFRNFTCLREILLGEPRRASVASLLADHELIMDGQEFAGKFRDCEVQIGGDDASNARAYPPPHEFAEEMIDDLVEFVHRSDIGIVSKCAIVHSHFESIHPFEDGNGRTGRALTQRMLLANGYMALPVSAALYAVTDKYFETFDAYEQGCVEYPVIVHAAAFRAAAVAVSVHIGDRDILVDKWRRKLGLRQDSKISANKALAWIASNPAFTAQQMAEGIGVTDRTVSTLLFGFEDAGIIQRASKIFARDNGSLRRGTVWEAKEMYELAERVEAAARRNIENTMLPSYSEFVS